MRVFGDPPDELHELAGKALEPDGIGPYIDSLRQAIKGPGAMFWAYRTLGPLLPGPGPAALLLRCVENGVRRPEAVIRALGDEWKDADATALGLEMFRRMFDHPEGVVLAVADRERNFLQHVGWEDGRVRLAPKAMLAEIKRALDFKRDDSGDYPLTLASGLRTHWTANAIHRAPEWRKGKGPFCTLHIAPQDAAELSIGDGQPVAVTTNRGSLELPAELDPRLLSGHVWIPNGFGVVYPDQKTGEAKMQGVNINEIPDAQDRDPISGCPHHKAIPCRVSPLA
jgi:formate dehydrogenase